MKTSAHQQCERLHAASSKERPRCRVGADLRCQTELGYPAPTLQHVELVTEMTSLCNAWA